jgi:predicted lipoprotein with Yx(FWY)xxD motif
MLCYLQISTDSVMHHRKEGTNMKSLLKYMVATMVVVAFLAGGIALAGDTTPVKVATKDGIGSYLACDVSGGTLYMFKKDTPGKSACEGECLAKWPLYYVEKVEVKDGLDAKNFGTITRADGKKQTTYKGMPLYFFAGDKNPGDTNGQGVKDVWFVVKP